MNEPEPLFDIVFFKANFLVALPECYIIDIGTIRDLLAAIDSKTASQAYRRAKLLEILEQDTSLGGGAEKKTEV